jgi:hypothetical protein
MSARRESAPAVIESPLCLGPAETHHDVLESRGEPLGVAICDLPAPTLTLKTNSDFCGWGMGNERRVLKFGFPRLQRWGTGRVG